MEQRKITWAPSAYHDLKEGFDYIAQDDSAAAQAWVKQILSNIERLVSFPNLTASFLKSESLVTVKSSWENIAFFMRSEKKKF